jgi:hypothetical protein
MDEVIGGERKLRNDQVKQDEMGRAWSTSGEKRNAYRIFMGNPEGYRPLGWPRRRWEDNIKVDLKEIGWYGMDWTDLAQDRDQWRALVNTVMNSNVWKFLSSCASGGFSRRAQLYEFVSIQCYEITSSKNYQCFYWTYNPEVGIWVSKYVGSTIKLKYINKYIIPYIVFL